MLGPEEAAARDSAAAWGWRRVWVARERESERDSALPRRRRRAREVARRGAFFCVCVACACGREPPPRREHLSTTTQRQEALVNLGPVTGSQRRLVFKRRLSKASGGRPFFSSSFLAYCPPLSGGILCSFFCVLCSLSKRLHARARVCSKRREKVERAARFGADRPPFPPAIRISPKPSQI